MRAASFTVPAAALLSIACWWVAVSGSSDDRVSIARPLVHAPPSVPEVAAHHNLSVELAPPPAPAPVPPIRAVGVLVAGTEHGSRALLEVRGNAPEQYSVGTPIVGPWVLSRIEADAVYVADGAKSVRVPINGGDRSPQAAAPVASASTRDNPIEAEQHLAGFNRTSPGMDVPPSVAHENNQRFLQAIQQRTRISAQ
jgi:hypothetical protein